MKKKLVFTILIFTITLTTSFNYIPKQNDDIEVYIVESDYCEGWEDGYCEGWKDVKGIFAICPIAPICPIAEIGRDSYKGGYNRGFKKGRKDATND